MFNKKNFKKSFSYNGNNITFDKFEKSVIQKYNLNNILKKKVFKLEKNNFRIFGISKNKNKLYGFSYYVKMSPTSKKITSISGKETTITKSDYKTLSKFGLFTTSKKSMKGGAMAYGVDPSQSVGGRAVYNYFNTSCGPIYPMDNMGGGGTNLCSEVGCAYQKDWWIR